MRRISTGWIMMQLRKVISARSMHESMKKRLMHRSLVWLVIGAPGLFDQPFSRIRKSSDALLSSSTNHYTDNCALGCGLGYLTTLKLSKQLIFLGDISFGCFKE